MRIISLAFLLLLQIYAWGQSAENIPDHFKQVDQTLWVVADLDQVISQWKQLGFEQVADLGTVTAKFKSSGKRFPLRMARANLGEAIITWIAPSEEDPVFHRFRQDYGNGAMSLVHRLDDKKSLKSERERLAGMGVGVLEEIDIKTKEGKWTYLLMDTRKEGKYTLGYVFGEDDQKLSASLSADNRHNMRLTQYAFAVQNVKDASPYWKKIGFPEIEVTPAPGSEREYYGEPADFTLELGWQRHGDITYEWCIPLTPPTVYQDHMEKHGEGIQHLGFAVSDMDAVIEDYAAKGFDVSMSGAWGEKGKPGSGRFAYIDLEEAGGLTVELLWSYRGK